MFLTAVLLFILALLFDISFSLRRLNKAMNACKGK